MANFPIKMLNFGYQYTFSNIANSRYQYFWPIYRYTNSRYDYRCNTKTVHVTNEFEMRYCRCCWSGLFDSLKNTQGAIMVPMVCPYNRSLHAYSRTHWFGLLHSYLSLATSSLAMFLWLAGWRGASGLIDSYLCVVTVVRKVGGVNWLNCLKQWPL